MNSLPSSLPLNRPRSPRVFGLLLAAGLVPAGLGCDLCAVYKAADAQGNFGSGFSLTVATQFVPYGTEQFDGTRFDRARPDSLERYMNHLVVGYNPGERFGISLNLPVIHQTFDFAELHNGIAPRRVTGSETGIGDASIIGRVLLVSSSDMNFGFNLNLLAGLKLPTGDPEHLEDLSNQLVRYEAVVGPNHNHDALGQVVSGVHLHDITLGSGSVDGFVGLTGNLRWQRYFLGAQAQYYARTEGAGDYRMADEFLLSGGPGVFLLLTADVTLSLQANGTYLTRGSDELFGRASAHTGLTATYVGPSVSFTWNGKFTAVAGADIPVNIANSGFQNVPEYRLNLNLSWRF